MDRDSLDEFSAEEMLVVASDNIQHQLHNMALAEQQDDEVEEDEPPKSLVVTGVDITVFIDETAKAEFESKFQEFYGSAAFYYIRTFRRVRVDLASHLAAAAAKQRLDLAVVAGHPIHCYFIRVFGPQDPEEAFLQPPPLEKQFLISPPCSPPVGWTQPREDRPVVDYDLLAAMAQLAPGQHHELHPSSAVTLSGNSINTPSIVVQVCGEAADSRLGFPPKTAGPRAKIVQTRCPERQHSLED